MAESRERGKMLNAGTTGKIRLSKCMSGIHRPEFLHNELLFVLRNFLYPIFKGRKLSK